MKAHAARAQAARAQAPRAHGIKTQRCAIYTRKSTEHNLDLAFNSLDAQREACEAYIKSQAHEGWRLAHGRYDDGGLSGASLERPALQGLLDEIRARRIDIVVVYKVDRLTRSLADFAKLVELFDAHGVSFVSVTQSFNTTSSMGRLTLNVLLSFAQFEREVIGERVRDKIAASKRKGIWVGGPVPLGYNAKDKVLAIVPDEAASVRTIFDLYLTIRSVAGLVAELERLGITARGGNRFGVGGLAHLLRNRFYIGEVAYRGEIYPGPQQSIVERATFQAVQEVMDAQAVLRRGRLAASAGLLTGLLYDDRGHRLTPSHTNKRGQRYRYYVSQAVLQNNKDASGSITRIAAPDIEAAVVTAVRAHFGIEANIMDHNLVRARVRSVVIGRDRLNIKVYDDDAEMLDEQTTTHSSYEDCGPELSEAGHAEDDERHPSDRPVHMLSVPWTPRDVHRAKGVRDDGRPGLSDAARNQLLLAIAKARRWMRDVALDSTTFADIAREEGCGERHVRFLAPLAYLSPSILKAIHDGRAPAELTISSLARCLPQDWASQDATVLC